MIKLDDQSLDPEDLSQEVLKRELFLQKRPKNILFKMMNILEQKRMDKKLGWSRPWNKYNLSIFRTHIHFIKQDREYLQTMFDLVLYLLSKLSVEQDYANFAKSLMQDQSLLAFSFYQNRQDDEGDFEGICFSIGVKQGRFRDRLDLIFEDKRRNDGSVDSKLDQLRLYINPYKRFANDEFYLAKLVDNDIDGQMQGAYDLGIETYHQLKANPKRLWKHWSINYIDYFRARDFIPKNSAFT